MLRAFVLWDRQKVKTIPVRPWTLRRAHSTDWRDVERILIEADLPLDGAREQLSQFLIAVGPDGVCGCIVLEKCGTEALLRSVAVTPTMRGNGLGTHLVRHILEEAREGGHRRVFLLTTTASRFFKRCGFRSVARSEAPEPIRESVQFREACPESAVLMCRAE